MIDLDELQRISDAATKAEHVGVYSPDHCHAFEVLETAARNALPELIAMGRENVKLRERVSQLETMMRKYCNHTLACINELTNGEQCNCGFDAAFTELDDAKPIGEST